MTTKENRPKRVWVDKGKEFGGEFKELCKAKGKQIKSTLSETKAAFAERTIRVLKLTLYRYMEYYAYEYIRKLFQFVIILNLRNNCLIDLIPKTVKIFHFLSILYSKPLREYRKPKFPIGDGIHISKYDLRSSKGHQPKFLQETFEISAISSKKPPTYTIKDK